MLRARAGEKIIGAEHLASGVEQLLSEMRPQEPRSAGNQNSPLEMPWP
jgi:hypothetical protein